MKNFKLNLRWLHGSPNQTGETLTRENRLGIGTCLNPMRTLCTTLLLLTLGTGQMWAWNTLYLASSNNSWSTNTDGLNNSSNGKGVFYSYTPANMTFKIVNANKTTWLGRDNGDKLKPGDSGYNFDKNKSNNCTYNGNTGIVGFNCDQTGTNADDYPWIWLTRPTIQIKHKWNNSDDSWTAQNMTDNNDGTYSYIGNYSGSNATNCGLGSDGSTMKYITNATLVGDPQATDRCVFEYNASGYKGFGEQNENTGSLTITKLCGLTYDGNGRDGGTAVPTALSDQKAGSTITLSSAAMTKTGYTLTGWNTAADGSGTHYDLGASFTFSNKTNTLYAEWTQTITVDANTGNSAGSMSIYFNAGSLKTFTAASKTDWVLDSYWTTSDESGVKVINYDGENATLVSNVSGYTNSSGKWTRTAATTLFAHWKQTYRVTYYANYPVSATSTGGDVPTDATEYGNGATVTVKTNSGSLTAGGYTFDGWQTTAGGGTHYATGATFSISNNTPLYAKWTENLTSVTLVASPSGRGSFTIGGSPATSTSAGVATKPTVTAVPITGYFLTGTIWSADNSYISLSADNAASTTITGCGTASTSSTLTASFTEKYLLCGSVNEDGDPEGGMRGWSETGNNNAYSSVTYDDNTITIVAALTNAATQYKCKIRDVENSAWKGQTGSGSMSSGGQWTWDGTNDVYFTTTVAGNYTFTIDISDSSPSVRITYPGEPEYSATLSVHSSGHGSVSPSAGSITLRPVTTTTITATPEPGYRFKQWNITGSITPSSTTSATETFTATAAGGTIEAEFTNEGIIYLDKSAISSKWNGTPYVYFYSGEYWNDKAGSGSQTSPSDGVPGTCISASNAMTRIGESQIWYYDYSALLSAGTSKQYIAFVDNSNQTGKNWFDACSVIHRGDFYPGASMFVVRDYTVYKNQHGDVKTAYYNEGYWRKYNDTDPGYALKIFNGTGSGSTQIGYARFASTEPGSNTCTAKVNLSTGTKGFKVEGCDTTTINSVGYAGTWYSNSGTMTSANSSNWEFVTSVSNNCGITPSAAGDYIFTLSLADGRLYVSAEYPLADDDYRIVYNGKVKTTGDATHHPSNFIRSTTNGGIGKDTVSFFVTDDGEGDPDWSLTLQKCTDASANPVQWANACDAGHTVTAADLGLSGKTGVYVFEIKQNNNGSCEGVTISNQGEYTGNYYIRTDVATGGWEAYKTVADNTMIFSSYSKEHSGYDYYHCHWTPTNKNVKFTIANDYSACITDTVENDTYVTSYGKLPYQASVRFMYNSTTNVIGRAYLNGSSEEGANTFLWLQGASSEPKIFKINGSALTNDTIKMQDKNNWIYQLDIKANETARVKLISNYRFNNKDHLQYFKGSAGDWGTETTAEIIGGTNPSAIHDLRIIYDFKTNRLLSAWLVPESGTVSSAAIHTDVMILQQNQDTARQITFAGADALTEIDTVYSTINLTKNFMQNIEQTNSEAARQFFYVSFPYDVDLSDVFGSVGEYGVDWAIQWYDGKKRAREGFWADSEPNWKFFETAKGSTLRAYEGYVLTLNLSKFLDDSKWKYGVTDIYLYFPSKDKIGTIHNESSKTVRVMPEDENTTDYTCTINRATPDGNRTIKDSHWHCIGSPSFARNSSNTWNKHGGTSEDWKAENLPFLYEWNSATNTLAPVTTSGNYTFKPLAAYLVQYEGPTITWTNVVTVANPIVARRAPETPDKEMTFKLSLMRGEEKMDQTFVRISDNEAVTSGFEFGQDLCKEFQRGANIYTIVENTEVAGNSLPLETEKTTTVPVGIRIATAGEYTFAMPEGTNGTGVVLVDTENGTRTNLALGDYTVTLGAGTTDGRFVLEISPVANTPTGIGNVQGDNVQCTKAQKRMIDGILYIVKDGKAYDARGTRVE